MSASGPAIVGEGFCDILLVLEQIPR